jgi:hypothetical protein
MRYFFHDTRGSAVLWTLFLILVLFTLSAVIYTGIMVYAKYQACETDLERATIVTVDMSLLNSNVRDVELDIPAELAQGLIEDNLIASGWTREDGNWAKRDGGKLIYRLDATRITVAGEAMCVEATLALPLPWDIGGQPEITIPIVARCKVIFLD